MPRDGEEPRFKFRFAVVLVAAFEHADPSFLEKILRARFVAGDIHEVAEQPVLILLDQTVQQVRVAPLQAARDAFGFIAHQRGKRQHLPKEVRAKVQTSLPGSRA